MAASPVNVAASLLCGDGAVEMGSRSAFLAERNQATT